jgi:ribosome-associated protein
MTSNIKNVGSEALSDAIVSAIEEKKGNDIVLMDLRQVDGAVCDFFVICDAGSNTQIKAIADSVVKEVRTNIADRPWHTEGLTNCEWVLLDYSNVVVHIFLKEKREFFKLEELWADAKITRIDSAE